MQPHIITLHLDSSVYNNLFSFILLYFVLIHTIYIIFFQTDFGTSHNHRINSINNPSGGSRISQRGDTNFLFDIICAKHCTKMKEIEPRQGASLVASPLWIRQYSLSVTGRSSIYQGASTYYLTTLQLKTKGR